MRQVIFEIKAKVMEDRGNGEIKQIGPAWTPRSIIITDVFLHDGTIDVSQAVLSCLREMIEKDRVIETFKSLV